MSDTTLHAADQLRIDARKIIDTMGISLQQIIPRLSEAGNPDAAALNAFDAQIYLDKVTALCTAILLSGFDMPTVEESKKALTGPSNKRRDMTPALPTMDEAPGIGDQAKALLKVANLGHYQSIITKYAREKRVAAQHSDVVFIETVKACIAKIQSNNNRIPITETLDSLMEKPTVDIMDMTDEQILAAVTAAGNDFSAEVDELTGKAADVIQGEIVDDALTPGQAIKKHLIESDRLDPDRPSEPLEPEMPAVVIPPHKTDADKVAEMINAAFPDATKDYKLMLFRRATGYNLIASAVKEIGSASMFALLEKEIAESKAAEPALPKSGEFDAPTTNTAKPIAEIQIGGSVTKSEPQTGQAMIVAPAIERPMQILPPAMPRSLQIMATDAGKAVMDFAKSAAASKMFPGVDSVDKAIVIIWKGVELGIEPFAALEGIFVIMGKPSLSASLMLSLANTSGLLSDIRIIGDETYCEVTMWRKDRSQPHTERFTVEDAQRAGLFTKQGSLWPKYPKSMCKARAISNCFKAVCPELAMGIRGVADDDEQDEEKMMARELAVA